MFDVLRVSAEDFAVSREREGERSGGRREGKWRERVGGEKDRGKEEREREHEEPWRYCV